MVFLIGRVLLPRRVILMMFVGCVPCMVVRVIYGVVLRGFIVALIDGAISAFGQLISGLASVLIRSFVALLWAVHHVKVVGGCGRPMARDWGATSALAVATSSSSMYSTFSEL